MSKKLLSVLIPIYNDEKYLSQTLDSVLSAVSEGNRDLIEYIFINDGSTDKTHDILEDYRKRFDITVVHQENRGAFPTTKALVEMATGKYFITIDHDDLLVPQALDKLIGYLQENPNKDCVIFNHCDFTDNNTKEKMYINGCNFYSTNGQDVFVQLQKHRCYSDPLWNRVMLRETIVENNVFSGHPLELDILVSVIVYDTVKNVGYFPEILYRHRIHPQSLSHSQNSQSRAKCHLYAIAMLERLICNYGAKRSAAFLKALHTKICDLYFGAVWSVITKDTEGKINQELVDEIEKYTKLLKYGKWNRKYIYRPLIKIFGLKAFCKVRKWK